MAAAALPLLSGIGGIFQGIGASKPKTSTSTSESTSTQDANLSSKQKKVNKALFQQIIEAIKQGPNVSQSDRNTARGQINDTYNAGDDATVNSLVARGYGDSGKVGASLKSNEMQRNNAFQGAEATLRDQAWQKFMSMISAGFQFDQPRSFTSTSSGTQTGTQSGTPWQSSVGGGIGDLSSYLQLQKLMGAGGGGAGGFGLGSICHIAHALYGEDWRVLAVRGYLLERARGSWLWLAGVALYALTGRHVARLIRWNRPTRRVFQVIFDRLAVKAIAA